MQQTEMMEKIAATGRRVARTGDRECVSQDGVDEKTSLTYSVNFAVTTQIHTMALA